MAMEEAQRLAASSPLRKVRQLHHELVDLLDLLVTQAEVFRLRQADILEPPMQLPFNLLEVGATDDV